MVKQATIESDIYRYTLTRTWDKKKPHVMFILLNPSTADHEREDPTSRRCAGFAKLWGYGGFHICNLFAFRATDPRELRKDPLHIVGPQNDLFIQTYARNCDQIIVAWGNDGRYLGRDKEVLALLKDKPVYSIGPTSKLGQPKHPLYLPYSAERLAFNVLVPV